MRKFTSNGFGNIKSFVPKSRIKSVNKALLAKLGRAVTSGQDKILER